jgi:RNA-directed DNA polymerase
MWRRFGSGLAGLFGRRRASDAASHASKPAHIQAPQEPTPSESLLAAPQQPMSAPAVPGPADPGAAPGPTAAESAIPAIPAVLGADSTETHSRDTTVDDLDEVLTAEGVSSSPGDDQDDEGPEDEDDEDALRSDRHDGDSIYTRDRKYFGEETWGASMRHQRAETDAARLAHYSLPPLADEAALASWLGIPLGRLRWYTRDRPADTSWHYVRYTIPKRSGGERVILAPKRDLKALQRRVLSGILARVPVAPSAHGFVRGRSIVSNASAHTGRQVVLKLDLKDFFPSVTFPRVRGCFISLGYSFAVASTLALLCTEYERQEFERDGTRYFISVGARHLVQGAPTSPALANLVAWRLDRRLSGLATKQGFIYTRYADDLTFSGNDAEVAARLRAQATRIAVDERFTVNAAKTRLTRRAGRQTVTGLVVNDALSTPREQRRRLRAVLHNASRTGLEAQNRDGRQDFTAYLMGQIAFVHAANPRHAAPLRAHLRRLVGRPASRGDVPS